MRKGQYINALLRAIAEYRLDDRYPELAQIVQMAEHGMLSDNLARGYLQKIQPLIEQLERSHNCLPRVAEQDELPEFDFTLAELIENPEVRIGIRLLDRPRHITAAGATGTGKSNLLRALIYGVDQLNRGCR